MKIFGSAAGLLPLIAVGSSTRSNLRFLEQLGTDNPHIGILARDPF